MTTVNVAALTNVLQKIFANDVTSTINRSAPLLQIMEMRKAEGQNIQWDVSFGSPAAAAADAAIAEGDDVSVFNNDTDVPAVLTYGTYHDAFEVTGKAVASAMASGNPQQIANLFRYKAMQSAERLAKQITEEIYNGDGTGERMTGLLQGGITDTGTYAGIDRAVRPQWAGNKRANGGVPRALTFALMRAASRDALTASGRRPGLLVAGPATHEQYGLLFGQERRYLSEVTVPGGGTIKLDGGYKVLEFDGYPILEDINCPEGKILFLNLDFVRMRYLPQPGTDVTGSGASQEMLPNQMPNAGKTRIQLPARLQPLAINGDKYRFAWYVYPQLQVENPHTCSILADISYTA